MLREIVREGMAIAGLRIGGAALAILVTVIIGRYFGAAGLGYYTYGILALSLTILPVGYGWGTMLFRETVDARKSKQWGLTKGMAYRGAQLAAVFSLAVALIFLVAIQVSGAGSPSVAYMVGLFLVAVFAEHIIALGGFYLRGMGFAVLSQMADAILKPLIVGCVLLAIALGNTALLAEPAPLIVLFAATAIVGVARLVAISQAVPADARYVSAEYDDRKWWPTAAKLAASSGLIVLNSYVDLAFLAAIETPAELGIYRVAAQIASVSGIGYVALNFLASEKLARFRSTNQLSESRRIAKLLSLVAMLSTIPIPLFFLVAGEPFLTSVLGPDFRQALPAALILCALQTASAAAGMANIILLVHGREDQLIKLSAMCVALNIGLNAFLVPAYGGIGAAVATFISIGLWNAAAAYVAWRETAINPSCLAALAPTRRA
jgi:O-antigen/teichoic acid export membrane protein